MKKYYFFILFFILFGIQNTFSQTIVEKGESKSSSKTILQLMALDSIVHFLAPSEPTIFEYDERGNLILIKDVFHKIVNTYNQDSLLLSSLFHIWDYDSNCFRPHELTEYTYDNNRRLIQDIMSVKIDNVWLSNSKRTQEYTNDLKSREINYYFNRDLNDWILSTRIEYFYNNNHLIVNENTYYFDNAGDNDYLGSRVSNTYDPNNNMTYSLFESYNDTATLVYGTKTYFTYNSDNLLTEQLLESYSYYYNTNWTPYNKIEISYNTNNLKLSQYTYMYGNEAWNLHNIDSFYYDVYTNQVLAETYLFYNEAWLCSQKVIHDFDYNYTSDQLLKPKPSPANYTLIYFENYSHMLKYDIQGTNYSLDADAWSFDTSQYFYSLKSIQISLPANVVDNVISLMVYPNPTNEKTIISLVGVEGEIEISIYDIQSREIMRIVEKPVGIKLEVGIDVSSFKKGTYFLKLRNGKYSQTKKLIVN